MILAIFMKTRDKLVLEDLEANSLPLIDISSYFTQKLQLHPEDYFLAEKFSEINPILERAQREIILDETLLDKNQNPDLNLQKYNSSQKSEVIGHEDRLNSTGLENLLQTQNPIVVFAASQSIYSLNYANQNQRGLNYRLGQSSYPRQFAWYDMPKQNIIALSYYKRH